MSEPVEMIAEDARRKSDQALLLARIFASVVTLLLLLLGALAGSSAARYSVMFAELGFDAELPVISRFVTSFGGVLAIALPLLGLVTLFFIWAKGRAAAWMAGLGLLILAVAFPTIVFALFLPLSKIMSEMGNM
jgi:hypothetical protein